MASVERLVWCVRHGILSRSEAEARELTDQERLKLLRLLDAEGLTDDDY